jgi:hypothetical protein
MTTIARDGPTLAMLAILAGGLVVLLLLTDRRRP